MVNDKNHLYSKDDYQKDLKDINKVRASQGFSRFSLAQATSLNDAGNTQAPEAMQIDTRESWFRVINDTFGSIGAITQELFFGTLGTGTFARSAVTYNIYEITDDVTFTFAGVPSGYMLPFTIDFTVNKATNPPEPIITWNTSVINPPVLTGLLGNGTRHILHFETVNDGTNIRQVYIGGTFSAAGGGGSQTPWLSNIDADGFNLFDLSNLLFRVSTQTLPIGSDTAIWRETDGLHINVPDTKEIFFEINDTIEYSMGAGALDLETNNLAQVGTILFTDTVQTIGSISNGLEVRQSDLFDFSWWFNGAEEYTMNQTDFTFDTNKLIFEADKEIFSSGSSLVIDSGGGVSQFIALETDSLTRMLIADGSVTLQNSAELRANGNAVTFDTDHNSKIQALSDDVIQIVTGGVLRISISNTSTTFLNTLIPAGDIDMNGADIIGIDDLVFDLGNSIREDGTGLTIDVTDGAVEGALLVTFNGGTQKALGINEIVNEITPYLDFIPGGTTDTLDMGAPSNLWHHIYMGGRLEFRAIEAQGAADTAFRIFRDADGMTWQLGLEGATDFGRISFVDKDNVERIEFDWNVGNRRANFNFLTEGMAIRQNASSVDGVVIYPTNNVIASGDSVISFERTGIAATDGLSFWRAGVQKLKIDANNLTVFNGIIISGASNDLNCGGNVINNTSDIVPASHNTKKIGTDLGTDAYADIYVTNVHATNIQNSNVSPVNSISIGATSMTLTVGALDVIDILLNGGFDFQFQEDQFNVKNGSKIVMSGTDGYFQMAERAGDPIAGTSSGKFYVKTVAGDARPFFIGDGTAAVALDGAGGGVSNPLTISDTSLLQIILDWNAVPGDGVKIGEILFRADSSTTSNHDWAAIEAYVLDNTGTDAEGALELRVSTDVGDSLETFIRLDGDSAGGGVDIELKKPVTFEDDVDFAASSIITMSSAKISGDLISSTGTGNLGGSGLNEEWASCFFETLNIGETQTGLIRADASGVEIRATTIGDTVALQITNGGGTATRIEVADALISLNEDVEVTGTKKISSSSGSEIAFQVGDETLGVGSEGSIIAPYLESTTLPASNGALDTDFGDVDGAIGVFHDTDAPDSSSTRFFVRADGVWWHFFMTKTFP